jgi:multiple RNA-binding domain-containing protein 1
MATSRIFVRNLPVNLTEKDFRKHFSQRHAVTDIKIIPHRRIGYVGYTTPEDAEDAVKYFNKTFIRMSKLYVEPAKAVSNTHILCTRPGRTNEKLLQANDASLHPTRLRAADGSNSHSYEKPILENPLKRKRPSPPPEKNDPKLKEFLNVMQAPSKSKAWKNDDLEFQQEEAAPAVQPVVQPVAEDEEGGQSDDEYQPIVKKQKSSGSQSNQNGGREESEEPLEFGKPAKAGKARADSASGQDDSNWLKSRTGQLLGLDDEQADDGVVDQPRVDRSSSAEGADQTANSGHDETKITDSAPASTEEKRGEAVDEVETQIRNSKRLFLRNLPFTITDDALTGEFSPFGEIEEVCVLHPFHYITSFA